MNTVRVVCRSVGLSTNRIIKTTVSVECSFGLVKEAMMGAMETLRVNHAVYSDPINELLGRAKKNDTPSLP